MTILGTRLSFDLRCVKKGRNDRGRADPDCNPGFHKFCSALVAGPFTVLIHNIILMASSAALEAR